jgi:hypothetical protein
VSTFGLTAAGLVIKTLDDLQTDLETDIQNAFGASSDLSSMSNFGQFTGSMAERLSELWNLELAVYNAQTAEGATGTAEDSINSLTGCIRLSAVASSVQQAVTGTNGTVVTAGSIVAVTGANGNQFEAATSATLATATPWTATTTIAAGAYVTNGGNIYNTPLGGVTGGGSGPTGTTYNLPITDGAVTWQFVGQGAAMALVECTATLTGPLTSPAYTCVVIVTPIAGWFGTWNPLDGLVGSNVETDSAYRLRRDEEIGAEGTGYLNAIRAAILKVGAGTDNPVTACTVFENITDETNAAGDPPHSIEALVQGGDNLAVATAIFNNLPAGIQPFGQTNTVTETIADSAGNPQTVQFSRPNPITIYVVIAVTINPESPNFISADAGVAGSPATVAAIQQAIVVWGNALGSGFSVDQSFVSAQAFIANLGAWQVTSCTVGTAPSPVGSEVVITGREIPSFPTNGSTISVTVTQTVP